MTTVPALIDAITIDALDAPGVRADEKALVDVLRDAVDGGASVGFLPPLALDEARAYWRGVADAVAAGSRVVVVARRAGTIVGTAQLDLATRANARHRAEVMKVMVLRASRRHGVGRALMLDLERRALGLGRTTLVLDTRQGDPSERLYASVGYVLAGAIPRYAESADGALHATAFYYRLLAGVDDERPRR